MNAPVSIVHGEALRHLASMPDASVDAIICDPPYGLSNTSPEKVTDALVQWAQGNRGFVPEGAGFMGAGWDSFVPPPAIWDQCLRVLKPGGHLAAFAGSRTHDLMTISIRFAGFEIRDQLAWVYGGGMPHGQDVGKTAGPDWAGYNTALKPAVEPIVLARKPLAESSVARNVLKHGAGALNVDATRIAHRSEADLVESTAKNQHADFGTAPGRNNIYGDHSGTASKNYEGSKGRHPANVILSHASACTDGACVPGCQVAVLDAQSGTKRSAPSVRGTSEKNTQSMFGCGLGQRNAQNSYGDVGGASRFFLTTPAGQADPTDGKPRFLYAPKAPSKERPTYERPDGTTVRHVSVKPLAVMRWLVRMLTPTGGVLVDPFAGSGTTLEAAVLEGFRGVGIERESEYIPLIVQRLDRAGAAFELLETGADAAA